MRGRSIVVTVLGLLLVGFTVYTIAVRFPREPCRGIDCASLFGTLPQLILTVLGGLLLAAGTFESATDRYEIGHRVWFSGWGLLCGGAVGTYLAVLGPTEPVFYWLPTAVGGAIDGIRAMWGYHY